MSISNGQWMGGCMKNYVVYGARGDQNVHASFSETIFTTSPDFVGSLNFLSTELSRCLPVM